MKNLIYQSLEDFLRGISSPTISLSFPKIEEILGRKLPPTAYKNDTWWTNNPVGHSQAKAWLAAGFEKDSVDRAAMTVVFRRRGAGFARKQEEVRGMSEAHRTFEPAPGAAPGAAKASRRSPLFGCMKGTFTIEPGYDLTSPAFSDEEWKGIEREMDEDWDQIDEGLKGGK